MVLIHSSNSMASKLYDRAKLILLAYVIFHELLYKIMVPYNDGAKGADGGLSFENFNSYCVKICVK